MIFPLRFRHSCFVIGLCVITCLKGIHGDTSTKNRTSCSDLYKYHDVRQPGVYTIDVDGEEGLLPPFNVSCEIEKGRDIYHVWTVVHHDTEEPTKVLGLESSGSYIRNVTYLGAKIAQVTTLIDNSYSCQQYIKWACKGSMFGMWFPSDLDSWWIGRNWEPQYYWGGAETDSRACACHPYCYETPKNSTCNCDAKLKLKWLEDSGLLLDKSRLPVLQLRFGDTGDVNEAGQYTLGPLKCRADGHKDVFMGSFTAPMTFESKDYPEFYPPPFHRYTWHFKIPPHQAIELVFTDYEVLHWGAYNAVPNCKNVVSVIASYPDHNDMIKRFDSQRSSPPYFISDGSDVEVNVTLTTCNNDVNLPKGKGFQAEFRRTMCVGCEAGTGLNGDTTLCTGTPCAVIASYKYPFPHHWYTNDTMDFKHRWILKSNLQYNIVELKFNDLDVIPIPGLNKCTPEGGVIRIYDGKADFEGHGKNAKFLGDYCNLNPVVTIHSTQETLTVIYMFRAQKVGNGRGFHATIHSRTRVDYLPKPIDYNRLTNVAEGKLTRQSSTRDRKGANLAVDGSKSGGLSGASCSATNIEKEPWWQVDLQKKYLIYAVEIHVKPHTRMRNIRQRPTRWPHGYYALPMPNSGCPDSHSFEWHSGTRTHDMTYEVVKDEKVKHWSSQLQLKGGMVQGKGVEQHFCVKDEAPPTENHTNWDKGEYCIFQVGQTCPSGFRSGYIMWIDKRPKNDDYTKNWTRNDAEGHLPKGEYTPFNTTIYFCCRADGRRDTPIKLPATKPFYLLQFGKGCQKVDGMAERQQFFHFNEDLPSDSPTAAEELISDSIKYQEPHPRIDTTAFEKGLALYYCYYDLAHSFRGFRVLVDDTGVTTSVGSFYDNENYGIKHSFKYNFLQSFICVEYNITQPEFTEQRINCTQPLYGQYVTLQIYNRYDALQLCEVKIFGEEACGQPLGMASEEIIDRQLEASSSDESIGHFFTESRLNANDGWCTGPSDKTKFLKIDLSAPTHVTGVIMQGLSHAIQNAFVRSFLLTYSTDGTEWHWEEEPIGQQRIYRCEQCDHYPHANDLSVRYNLKQPIVMQFLKLHIVTFNEAPCLRMEILGCRAKIPCQSTLNDPRGGNVSSPGHPNYYGQDKDCTWEIVPPPGMHVQLKFIMFDMAPKENGRRTTRCKDDLLVFPVKDNKDLVVKSPDGINFPKMLISKGTMKINLKSCFRYSISRFRGFFATYQFLDCPGCGIGDYQCQKIHVCNSSCGHIASFGYPAPYQSNHRCRWLIQAEPTYFINVTFHDFDVVGGEGCLYDYIDFYDGETMNKDNLIGRYCNRRHPPRHLLSSWNKLLIEFSSDAEKGGRGFYLSFKAQKFGLPPELEHLDIDEPNECPMGWKYFENHCYNVFTEPDTLQWSEAESKCADKGKQKDGHLVSILSEKEMDVLHYLLTAVWRMHSQSLYIGLKDVLREGIYRWSDGNPMSYTDWAQAGKGLPSQPDGGTFQDCTVLKVDSGHSTAQWHDIPCSLGKHAAMFSGVKWGDEPQHGSVAGGTQATVQSYICKMESEKRVGDDDQKPLHLDIRRAKTTVYNEHKYFMCEKDKVFISVIFLCDRTIDCKDESDETNCPVESDSCPEQYFHCTNKRCISISLYCDFHDDCGDGSDETNCDHRACDKNEFQCLNKQCIPLNVVCDLRTDCEDGSDEENCAGNCNPEKTFQCFDGTCIPLYAPCDGRRDCPGKYHEDEPAGCFREEDRLGSEEEMNSCANLARKTCQDIYLMDGIRTSGYYLIDPDEDEGEIMPFQVHCKDMEGSLERVTTVVHHDTEHRIYVKSGSDGPGAYQRKIVYDTGLEEMVALINVSKNCRQHVRWLCAGTKFGFTTDKPVSWWVNRDGHPQYNWGGSTKDRTCGCYPNCENPNYVCNCDNAKVFEYKEDSGYLTNKSMLPISEVYFGNTFKAGYSGYHTIGPLECSGRIPSASDNCTATSQFLKCQSGHYISMDQKCLYQFDQFSYEQGCRDVTHLRNCEDFDCPKDYIKCPGSYCIPSYYICDGKWDCVEGADELDCENYICPGHYRCRKQKMCVPLHNLCDGVYHCPFRDDEKLCGMYADQRYDFNANVSCPKGCSCVGLYVSCRNLNSSILPESLPRTIRKLDFSHNKLNITQAKFDYFSWLSELSLKHNELRIIPARKFEGLRNLYFLDLRDNALQVIEKYAFMGLKSLKTLLLNNNHGLSRIEPEAFKGLHSLPTLNLTNVNMTVLRRNTFLGMENTEILLLRGNGIRYVEPGAFLGLPSVTHLDIQGNGIESFPSSMFEGLSSLNYLYSDSFKFCCLVNRQISFENCYPSADEISDCEDLMGSPLQRAVIWVLGVVALMGNLFVIIWRIKISDSNPSSILILSLGCADFLMGVYLIIIAGVDEHYRGRYMQISDQWRRSALCKVCGILSTVSSEVSVFTLVLITVDRLLSISFPFSLRHLSMTFTYKVITFSWFLAIVLAVVPLVFQQYFQGEFYARSGVCLALHITNKKPAGWEYSVAIFFCVNLVAFVIIVSAYGYMYFTVRKSYLSVNRMKAHRVLESRIAQQMAVIVMTNFLCWFPIIVMGLMAMSGVKVPGHAYAWTAVFVLPLNSATNPLVYTISTLHCRTVLARFKLSGSTWQSWQSNNATNPICRATSSIFTQGMHYNNTRMTIRESFLMEQTYKAPVGYAPLFRFLRDYCSPATGPGSTVPNTFVLNAQTLLRITAMVCKRLKEIHAEGYVCGKLSGETVFVSTEILAGSEEKKKTFHVYVADFYSYKTTVNSAEEMAQDMEDLAVLVKKMLRMYHVTSRLGERLKSLPY